MVALFGSKERYVAYLQSERDKALREEQLLKQAAAQSIIDEKEAREKRRVRKDQDVEYLQSLQQDKKRLAEEERVQRDAAEAEERKRREVADEQAAKREAEDVQLARAQSLKMLFEADEPTEGCMVTLHFPCGTRKVCGQCCTRLLCGALTAMGDRQSRRFGFGELVSRVVDFVEYLRVGEGVVAPAKFKLVQLPKTVLDPTLSVRAATGGGARALVYVMGDDDDDDDNDE